MGVEVEQIKAGDGATFPKKGNYSSHQQQQHQDLTQLMRRGNFERKLTRLAWQEIP